MCSPQGGQADPSEDVRMYWGGGETGLGLEQDSALMYFLF